MAVLVLKRPIPVVPVILTATGVLTGVPGLAEDGFALARRYYAAQAWKWTRHPYALELMWDGSVDALLESLRVHRADGLPFGRFLWELTKNRWRAVLRALRARRRDIRREWWEVPESLVGAERCQDGVDGRDLFDRAAVVLSEPRLAALRRWSVGEANQSSGSVRRALWQLREAV